MSSTLPWNHWQWKSIKGWNEIHGIVLRSLTHCCQKNGSIPFVGAWQSPGLVWSSSGGKRWDVRLVWKHTRIRTSPKLSHKLDMKMEIILGFGLCPASESLSGFRSTTPNEGGQPTTPMWKGGPGFLCFAVYQGLLKYSATEIGWSWGGKRPKIVSNLMVKVNCAMHSHKQEPAY